MHSKLYAALAVISLILVFLPTLILVVASTRWIRETGRPATLLVVLGALLLTLVSLDFLYTYVVALVYGPETLARFALYTFYIFKGMTYLGLLLIGVGLLRLPGSGTGRALKGS